MSIASKSSRNKADKTRVSGVILIDKPMGMTSQQVVSKVKYLFKSPLHDSKKAGHTGTLDPMATGLLPICLGEATKFSHYQLDADKSYQTTILLGQQTDTGDADGQVIDQTAIPSLNKTLLDEVTKQFLGAQQQIPPMYSALKKEGKKLYEYARAGIEIEREPRFINIKFLELTLINAQQLQLTVTCTKGTYVRVLAEDIAKALGTLGHLISLRRIKVGDFIVDNALTLEQLESLEHEQRLAQLMPVDACIDIEAELVLSAEQGIRVRQGQRLNVFEQITEPLKDYMVQTLIVEDAKSKAAEDDSSVDTNNLLDSRKENTDSNRPEYERTVDIRLVDECGAFIGLGAISLNGRLQPKKLVHL
ncbi:tRNA pseudouridine(55) synthase TruB [Psychrobacter jeotgali]|uniref:tRNA pseudouridine(55) synthase TruB n=1 Tax=Psychrobacter jeotgali TaxID=179010 RepID=UPI0019191504|nr:tRNA pseudouridine(55) synthase TruB [Psychrobacter jeotgali]